MAKRKRSTVMDKEDFISRLPDEVLSLIVSHLPLQEAARTSFLSKRWRHVWKLVLKLDFDAINLGRSASDFIKLIQHDQDKFVQIVNQVLQLCQSERIESFTLRCCLGPEYSSQIDKWLHLAVNRSLQNLDINTSFPLGTCSESSANCYEIPSWIFDGRLQSLTRLSLAHCSFKVPRSATCFRSLASLTLESTRVSQDNISIVLSRCPNLQSMSLSCCICPSHLELANQNQFLSLKHIAIASCSFLTTLSIYDAVGLQSFECLRTRLTMLTLQNTAKPVRVMATWQDFHKLGAYFPQLEQLMLISLPYEKMKKDVMSELLQQLPTFDKLQELVLDCSFHRPYIVLKIIPSLLKAAPNLQKLQVMRPYLTDWHSEKYASRMYKRSGEQYLHEHLREVTLYNCDGKCSERILVKYLLKNATALEKINIHRECQIYMGNWCWEDLHKRFVPLEELIERIHKSISKTSDIKKLRLF